MRQGYTRPACRQARPYRYRFARAPKALHSARLDNIAIVPASMLPLKGTIQHMLNTLPQGGVFLCHSAANAKQKRVLERVGEVFKQHGHVVTNLSLDQAVSL
jgi:hypothetical protein